MTRSFSDHANAVLAAVSSPGHAAMSEIAASWRRSALHHRIDPAATVARDIVEQNRLADLRALNGFLLSVAGPVLDHLFRAVGRSGCGIVLSDAQGTILDQRIGPSDREVFASSGLVPGANWAEAREGTNGIGTCLYEKKPVIVFRHQHFAARNIGLSCVDAPIYDPLGRLAGAIDVSTCRTDHGPETVEMIAALVADCAHRIERDLFCRHFSSARIIFLSDDPQSGTVLLAADRDDLLIGATHEARRRFNLGADLAAGAQSINHVLGDNSIAGFNDGDRAVLRQALANANGNASKAAALLGIGRATLYRRMARAGLN
ncbi:GAF domain-containing protein [Acetobacteraceae bacterium KSS8]|uniref:GAF domain-containing protein n=1 Tax=Endosaccharibacter trunci TaxID=2812733 RepID=A0ABT1W5J8_9PROT|nr:GAF domain-containing protein [Acetobacteraceae bacterium KSS8]